MTTSTTVPTRAPRHTGVMRAIVCPRFGAPDVLRLRQVAVPTPAAGDVLIRVHASAVTTADTMMRRGVPWFARPMVGWWTPRHPIPGTGVAGEIAAVGSAVTRFQPGDQVFGETGLRFGANAEYVCMPEDGLLLVKPDTLPADEAATICDGALTSLNFLRTVGGLRPEQHVLVIGASGSLGTAAVQLAKHLGAQVTGVCSTTNVELVRSLGANHVIDYTQEDFTRAGRTYDLIFDTVGKSSFAASRRALTDAGVYLSPVLGLRLVFDMARTARTSRQQARFSATGLRPVPELRVLAEELRDLIAAGGLRMVIDRRYPLEQLAEAHAYVETGRKRGNVVAMVA